MDENKSLAVEFVKQVLINFAAAVIAVSIVGWFVGDITKETGGLLGLGRDGLSYHSLLQLFIFSITQAVLKILLLSDLIVKEMLLLWRTVLTSLFLFLSAILFSVLFRWFPVGSLEAWISFIISITVCFVIGILLMIMKTKLEDKKYRILLSDYREKQKQEKGDEQ